jgi:hypothetical protein
MSLVRVHNFSISLDGFGTGDGQSCDAHFGHAGDRLHEWMFATKWGARKRPGGSGGIDDAFVRLFEPGSAQRSWVQGSSATRGGMRTRTGRVRGDPTRCSTHLYSSSRITPAHRSRWRAARFFTSSMPRLPGRSKRRVRPRPVRTYASVEVPPSSIREFLAAGLVDYMHLVVVPILLGRGVRLWDELEGLEKDYKVEATP